MVASTDRYDGRFDHFTEDGQLWTWPDSGDATIATTAVGNYAWTNPQFKVIIQNLATSANALRVRINGDSTNPAAAAAFDFEIQPGDAPFVLEPGLRYNGVSIYNAGAGLATYKTDFVVRGLR